MAPRSVHVSSSIGCNNCIIKLHGCYSTQAICTLQHTLVLRLQVRITCGKLASGSAIPRPALLARASRTRSYVGMLVKSARAGCSTVQHLASSHCCCHFWSFCHTCGCTTAGKKDTAATVVQAITHVDGSAPSGINRVARILAGRTRPPVSNPSQAQNGGFTSLTRQAGNSRTASWRGFAALAAC